MVHFANVTSLDDENLLFKQTYDLSVSVEGAAFVPLLTGADVTFEEPIFTVGSPGAPEYDTPSIRIDYTSMLTPASVYDYDLATRSLTLLRRTPVLGDFDADAGHYEDNIAITAVPVPANPA